MTPEFLTASKGGVCLRLKVQPRSSKNEIGDLVGAELKVRVTAPPVESAANEAVLQLFSEILDCPRNAIFLRRGQTSRHKEIFVQGLSPEVALERLQTSA